LLKHRYAIINLWCPIRGPLLDSPLALCDAQSLEEENLIASDLRYPDRTGETYSITYNPNQRYFYFPKMQPDETVLIRCYWCKSDIWCPSSSWKLRGNVRFRRVSSV